MRPFSMRSNHLQSHILLDINKFCDLFKASKGHNVNLTWMNANDVCRVTRQAPTFVKISSTVLNVVVGPVMPADFVKHISIRSAFDLIANIIYKMLCFFSAPCLRVKTMEHALIFDQHGNANVRRVGEVHKCEIW